MENIDWNKAELSVICQNNNWHEVGLLRVLEWKNNVPISKW